MNLGQIDDKESKAMSDDDDDEKDDDNDIDMSQVTQRLSASEWHLMKKQRMNEVKLEIANMGEKILTDPYVNVGLLDVIMGLLQDKDAQICQLAMLSLTRAIIDIMPPYKIGTIDENIALKRSNEKVREFEKTLLNAYQLYLKHIFKLAR